MQRAASGIGQHSATMGREGIGLLCTVLVWLVCTMEEGTFWSEDKGRWWTSERI